MAEVIVLNNSLFIMTDTLQKQDLLCFFQQPIWLIFLILCIGLYVKNNAKDFLIRQSNDASMLLVALFFVIGLIAAPFIIVMLLAFAIYRSLICLYLKKSVGQCFGGLLMGSDVIWAMELPEARSIITVLVLLEIPVTDVACSRGSYGKQLLDIVRKVAKESLLNPSGPFSKLTQLRRKTCLGYHYWVNGENLDVDAFVRFLDIRENSVSGLTDKELGQIIGECCNKPLPCRDTATWDILVGQQPLVNTDTTTFKLFPVLFRIHHTVGDGVALLRLLIECVADRISFKNLPADDKKKIWANTRRGIDEDSGYENDSRGSPSKDTIVTIPKEVVILKDHTESVNLKSKLKTKFGSFRMLMEKKSERVKMGGMHSITSRIRRLRRNTLTDVPRFTEIRNEVEIQPRPRSVTPEKNEIIEHMTLDSLLGDEEGCVVEQLEIEEKVIPLSHSNTNHATINLKDAGILLTVSIIVTFVTVYRAANHLWIILKPLTTKIARFAFFTPHMIFFQVCGGTDDRILYGKPLCGEKIVSWVIEKNNEDKLQEKIRLIRSKIGYKFTHILFACLSKSLQHFYLERKTHVPSAINLVLPARVDIDDLSKGMQTTATCKIGALRARVTRLYGSRRALKGQFKPENLSFSTSSDSDQEETLQKVERLHKALSNSTIMTRSLKLDNKFTVAMMKLPIGDNPSQKFTDLVHSVESEYNRLRKAPDYVANYWLLRWVAHLAPVPFLEPFLNGAPSTMVLSNLPGPEDVIHFAKKPIHDIVFWVPNRGLNGIGIGMLSYCHRFSFGIVADKALIADPDEAHRIIAGIHDEVNNLVDILGNQVTSVCQSR